MRAALALALLAAVVLAAPTRAQTLIDTLAAPDVGARFEALAEDGADGDPTALLELVESLRETPLDLNTATAEELAQVPALPPLLAAAVVRHRIASGPFALVDDLRLVEGVTPEVLADARPFLTVGPSASRRFPAAPPLADALAGLRYAAMQRVQRRLDVGEGFLGPDSLRAYPGSPARVYTRLQATYRRQVSVNLTLEKDPGEAFRLDAASGAYGYDYASAHAALLDAGRVDALVVGDFVAEFGQGVALWRASGFGKGPDAVQGPVRSGRGIRPYGSVDENRFFRGAALTLALAPRVYASAFASRRTLDASVLEPDTSGLGGPDDFGPAVTGLGTSGLHRTPREVAQKDALRETLVGGGAEVRVSDARVQGRAGVVTTYSQFGAPLAAGDRPDQRFQFAGDRAAVVSVYADAKARAGQVFGEAVRGAGGGFGGVAGVLGDLGTAEVLLVGRHYGADFTSLHGHPFGERNGAGTNETGLYAGVRVRPAPAWTVDAYFDQYRFPFLRYGVPRPSVGHEALVRLEHRPRRYLTAVFQARTETREVGVDVPNAVPGSAVGGLGTETRQTLRLHGEWAAGRDLRLRARVEGARYAGPGGAPAQTGSLVYHDVRWQATRRLRADARLTLFATDGYDARLYAFENDLTGVFAIPALSGRGVRAYALVSAEPLDGLVVQAKVAATWLRDVRSVGSGPDRVGGHRVADLGVQVRYQF